MKERIEDSTGDITFDEVKNWLDTNSENAELKKYLRPLIDRHVTKGIESYKTNNLHKEIEAKLNDNSEELKAKEKELMERETLIDLKNMAIEKAIENGITPAVAVLAVNKDMPTTLKNLNLILEEKNKIAEMEHRAFLSKHARIPQTGDSSIHIRHDLNTIIDKWRKGKISDADYAAAVNAAMGRR